MSLSCLYACLTAAQLAQIKSVSMDMRLAYISATLVHLPNKDWRVAFSRFNVAKLLNTSVDKMRRQTHKALM